MPGTLALGSTPNWPTTAVPAQQGNAAHYGYNDMPTGVWASVVNFRRLDAALNVGVAAAHICGPQNGDDGIQSVTFIGNNGTPLVVTEPTLNPETGLWEYVATIPPLAVDGILELRAIIRPHSGLSRVLQGNFKTFVSSYSFLPGPEESVLLWSNANGTYAPLNLWVDGTLGLDTNTGLTRQSPLQTLSAAYWKTRDFGPLVNGSHVIVNLEPGIYTFHAFAFDTYCSPQGWCTYQPAAGILRDQVTICDHDGGVNDPARQWLIHFKNVCNRKLTTDRVTFVSPSDSYSITLWFEGVKHYGSDKWSDGRIAQGGKPYYFTNSSTHRGESRSCKEGMRFTVVRNCDYDEMSGDGLNGMRYCRGSTMKNVTANVGVGDHLDMVQGFSMDMNSYIADNQLINWVNTNGFFLDRAKNHLAFINNVFHNFSGAGSGSISGGRGFIMWHNTFVNLILAVVADPTSAAFPVGRIGDGGGMEIATFSIYGNILGSVYYLDKSNGELSQSAFETSIDGSTMGRFSRNHYIGSGWNEGDNATFGALTWTNATAFNFFPSALVKSVPRCVPWDVFQNARSATTMHGAMEFVANFTVAPTLSPTAGIYEPSRFVLVTLESGAIGYFTTNGITPTNVNTSVSGSIALPGTCTLKVVALKNGIYSAVTSEAYQIIADGTPAPPRRIS